MRPFALAFRFPLPLPLPLLALLAAVLSSGCSRAHPEGAITYGVAPTSKGAHPLTLDVQVPDGPGPFPTIVFIHGGGWIIGDLTTYEDAIRSAARRGFVGITINYRLADDDDGKGHALSPWPAQIEDVRCALRWVTANAATYKIDPSRVAAVGESAGGHLSMMAGYAQNEGKLDPAFCPGKTAPIKAVVSIFGADDITAVYDSTEWWVKPYMTRWLNLPDGAKVSDHSQAFASANPPAYLPSGPKLPSHIIQGTADTVVPPFTQRAFVEMGLAAGQDITLEYLDGVGHDPTKVTAACNTAMDWLSTRL